MGVDAGGGERIEGDCTILPIEESRRRREKDRPAARGAEEGGVYSAGKETKHQSGKARDGRGGRNLHACSVVGGTSGLGARTKPFDLIERLRLGELGGSRQRSGLRGKM